MRDAFIKTLSSHAAVNPDIILITGDLGYGVLTEFCKKYPRQFVNAGICEQNMTAVATGMALEGKTVFTYSIGNFPSARCLEQIRNDVAYHGANVKIVSVGAGFSYGLLGMTHHATEDMSYVRAIPSITLLTPSDDFEAIAAADFAVNTYGPCYIRLDKGGSPDVHKNAVELELGKPLLLEKGDRAAIFVTGAIAVEALEASHILSQKYGISCAIYSFPFVKPIDASYVMSIAEPFPCIITLEEHTVVGGFGSAIAEVFAGCHAGKRLTMLGLKDKFLELNGSQQYLREQHGLDGTAIASAVVSVVGGLA